MRKKQQQRGSGFSQPITGIVVRAAIVAVTLGSVLSLANQWEGFFGAGEIEYLPLVLVYCTPFIVVTLSQIAAYRQAHSDARLNAARTIMTETLTRTTVSHGIPMRALRIGLAMGTINTTLVLAPVLLNPTQGITIPYLLLVQTFTLPIAFGILSQAISYRRAMRAFGLQST